MQASSCVQIGVSSVSAVTFVTVLNMGQPKQVLTHIFFVIIIFSACFAIARHNVRSVTQREDPVSADRAQPVAPLMVPLKAPLMVPLVAPLMVPLMVPGKLPQGVRHTNFSISCTWQFTGHLTGHFTGHFTGQFTGHLTGQFTGHLTGQFTGHQKEGHLALSP